MIKYICDHCHKETSTFTTLDIGDLFWEEYDYVGKGSILCDDCYDERSKQHAELDRAFLNVV